MFCLLATDDEAFTYNKRIPILPSWWSGSIGRACSFVSVTQQFNTATSMAG